MRLSARRPALVALLILAVLQAGACQGGNALSNSTPVQTTESEATRAPTGTGVPVTSPRPTVAGTAGAGGPSVRAGTTRQFVEGMTLEQKVGQMVMLGFDGADGAAFIEMIRRRNVGNAALLGSNIRDRAQLRSLTDRLQAVARAANGGTGMLIGVDQEGGDVQRLRPPAFTGLPSARRMAGTADPAHVRTFGHDAGAQLLDAGITMDFAPVLDVNDNPANPVIGDRAFGVTPATVTPYALAFLEGLHAANIAGVGKHFPGHGNTSTDSHFDLPYVTKGDAGLRAVELPPFQAAINAGIDALMVAHVVYTAWDSDRPASLSPRIITSLLRGELGYDGVVMTDDMNMKAITDRYGAGPAAVMAVEAGADVLVSVAPATTQEAMIDAVLAAVRRGQLSEERVDESVRRILALKARYGLL